MTDALKSEAMFGKPVDPVKPSPPAKEVAVDKTEEQKKLEETLAEKAKAKAAKLEEAVAILKEYNMKEGDIPINSRYWGLMNEYRGL